MALNLATEQDRINKQFEREQDLYSQQEADARARAERNRELAQQQLQTSLRGIESGQLGTRNRIQQGRVDQQRLNRQRARAMGGGYGSGFMDMQTRTDRDTSQQLATLGNQMAGQTAQANLQAQSRFGDIQSSLEEAMQSIAGNRMLSQRQKEEAMASARARAAQMAMQAQASNPYADLIAALGGEGNVLGASDSLEIDVPYIDAQSEGITPEEMANAKVAVPFEERGPGSYAYFLAKKGINLGDIQNKNYDMGRRWAIKRLRGEI